MKETAYIRKPFVVDAMQYHGDLREIYEFLGLADPYESSIKEYENGAMLISLPMFGADSVPVEGGFHQPLTENNWVVKDKEGIVTVLSDEDFKKKYVKKWGWW